MKSGIVQSDFQITDILSKWKAGFPKPAFDAAALKRDFPGLADPQLHYLGNAATAQMLKVVLDALRRFEVEARANVHEGMHRRARAAANAYQEARARVTRFLRAGSEREVVFTMEQPPRSIY